MEEPDESSSKIVCDEVVVVVCLGRRVILPVPVIVADEAGSEEEGEVVVSHP